MTESISVEVARFSEKDQLGEALRERGYQVTPVEETGRLGFEIDCDDGAAGKTCDDVLHEMEMLVAELETPFIPVRGDGFVFLRPPGD